MGEELKESTLNKNPTTFETIKDNHDIRRTALLQNGAVRYYLSHGANYDQELPLPERVCRYSNHKFISDKLFQHSNERILRVYTDAKIDDLSINISRTMCGQTDTSTLFLPVTLRKAGCIEFKLKSTDFSYKRNGWQRGRADDVYFHFDLIDTKTGTLISMSRLFKLHIVVSKRA